MARQLRFLTAVIGACFTLAACGGGGGGGAVTPVTHASGQTAAASMSFFIPSSASTQAGSVKHRNALPASTQSLEIVIASGGTTPLNPQPAPIILNVSNSSCTSVSGGLSCQYTIDVPFGALQFAVVAFAGTNATGAAIAEGTASATIGTGTNSVSVTMNSVSIYSGVSLEGGRGLVTIDHSANTFTVLSKNNNNAATTISGTVSSLPQGDLKLVVTASTDPGTVVGSVVYARELQGSVLLFASTGVTSPPANGGAMTGGDMGAGAALQGCPTANSSQEVSIAEIAGPAWSATPSTSPAYTNGTAAVTVSGNTTTVNFTGSSYSSSGGTLQPQTGSQVCANGIYSDTSGSTVSWSPDGIVIVGDSGNVQSNTTQTGGMGFIVSSGYTIDTPTLVTGTYDGFLGGFASSTNTTKDEIPIQFTPLTSNTMNACQYSNFESATINPSSCATITFGAAVQQDGVELVTATQGGVTTPGIIVANKASNGKFVIFGNIGGTNIELIEH